MNNDARLQDHMLLLKILTAREIISPKIIDSLARALVKGSPALT
jgi:hypothetical protein